MGLEPTRPIGHKILSLACLPISALPRDKVYISTAEAGWQQLFSFFVFAPGLCIISALGSQFGGEYTQISIFKNRVYEIPASEKDSGAKIYTEEGFQKSCI